MDIKNLQDTSAIKVKTWDLKRSRNYGSDHYNTKTLSVKRIELGNDHKELLLTIPDIKPTWVMQIDYRFTGKNGELIKGQIQNTIHQLGAERLKALR